MLEDLIFSLIEMLVRLAVAVGVAVAVLKSSKVLFGIDFSKEILKGNTAVSIFLGALILLISIVVALFRL